MDKPTKKCSIDGCDKEVKARGWCAMHYMRFRRHGDPLASRTPILVCTIDGCERDHSGRGLCLMHLKRLYRNGDPMKRVRMIAPETCTVDGCESVPVGRGLCKIHYQRWSRTGDPMGIRDLRGENNGRWVGEDANYFGVHSRLSSQRGKASTYRCDHCGNPAEHWAYTHNDPEEKVTANGLAYSTRIEEFYIPLCVECHSRFDAAW